ncbi:unnamed protein product [Closterium sp. Yama58-4]|nr:unnamed protein product [Closterium sp. Yama58-4]
MASKRVRTTEGRSHSIFGGAFTPLHPRVQLSALVTVYDDCYLALSSLSLKSANATPSLSLWGGIAGDDPFSYASPLDPALASLTPASASPLLAVHIGSQGRTWDNIHVLYLVTTTPAGVLQKILAQLQLPRRLTRGGSVGTSGSGAGGKDVLPGSATEASEGLRKQVLKYAKDNRLLAPPPPVMPPPPPPVPPPPPPVASPALGFVNCVTAKKGRLNIYWRMVGDPINGMAVEFGLEGKVPDNSWMALGLSGNQSEADMHSSDIAATGIFSSSTTSSSSSSSGSSSSVASSSSFGSGMSASNGGSGAANAFATDFYVTALEACEQIAGGYVGVCPDALLGSSPSLNNVNLTLAARQADVSFVRFRRSLALSTDPLFDRRFDISFPSAVPNNTDLSSPLLFIFATGPLLPSSTPSLPQLLPHAASAAFFSGSINITLNAAKATNSCEPLWNTPALSYPPLPPGLLPSPPGEPSMWDDGAVISGVSQCSTTFEGENRKFASCEALPGGVFFMWTLGKEELSGAFISQSVSPQGYAAVGLLLPPPTPLLEALFTPPPAPAGGNGSAEGGYVKPDSLVGASMLVAVRAEDGSGGLKVEEYQIVKQEAGGSSSNASATGSTTTGTLSSSSRNSSDGSSVATIAPQEQTAMVRGSNLSLISAKAELQAGSLTLLFTIKLPHRQRSGAVLLWTKGIQYFPANDSLSPDGIAAMASAPIDFGKETDVDPNAATVTTAGVVYSALSVAAWAFMLPVGAVSGRYVRKHSRYWFPLHQGFQLGGYFLTLAAFTIAMSLEALHKSVGYCVLLALLSTLMVLQISAVIIRPPESHHLRDHWRRFHKASSGFSITAGVWLALLASCCLTLEWLLWANRLTQTRVRPESEREASEKESVDSEEEEREGSDGEWDDGISDLMLEGGEGGDGEDGGVDKDGDGGRDLERGGVECGGGDAEEGSKLRDWERRMLAGHAGALAIGAAGELAGWKGA